MFESTKGAQLEIVSFIAAHSSTAASWTAAVDQFATKAAVTRLPVQTSDGCLNEMAHLLTCGVQGAIKASEEIVACPAIDNGVRKLDGEINKLK